MSKSTLATLGVTLESTHQVVEVKGNPRLPRLKLRARIGVFLFSSRNKKTPSVRDSSVASVDKRGLPLYSYI